MSERTLVCKGDVQNSLLMINTKVISKVEENINITTLFKLHLKKYISKSWTGNCGPDAEHEPHFDVTELKS